MEQDILYIPKALASCAKYTEIDNVDRYYNLDHVYLT